MRKPQVDEPSKLKITKLLTSLNHRAKIIQSSYGKVPVDEIVNTGLFRLDVAQTGYGWLQDLHAMDPVFSLDDAESSLDQGGLQQVSHGPGIVDSQHGQRHLHSPGQSSGVGDAEPVEAFDEGGGWVQYGQGLAVGAPSGEGG